MQRLSEAGITPIRTKASAGKGDSMGHAEVPESGLRANVIEQRVLLGGEVSDVKGLISSATPCSEKCLEYQSEYLGNSNPGLTMNDQGFLPGGRIINPEFRAELSGENIFDVLYRTEGLFQLSEEEGEDR